ncbi:hypothetical protein HLB23_33795 [Nocardia uniformis]|uniref:Uncharacterized protein n=1 Tax=Nocardia uniformis TaxID=53432 RepID=A0A849CAM5_9NOCA|nr:hypothetical protein [Nocardia uniformis]NNH74768.1 hypothetical protein [Nocardia uniformis]
MSGVRAGFSAIEARGATVFVTVFVTGRACATPHEPLDSVVERFRGRW